MYVKKNTLYVYFLIIVNLHPNSSTMSMLHENDSPKYRETEIKNNQMNTALVMFHNLQSMAQFDNLSCLRSILLFFKQLLTLTTP